jgi:hypothetical protein
MNASGSVSIKLGKESLSVLITRSINSLIETSPVIKPIEEVLVVSLFDSLESAIE